MQDSMFVANLGVVIARHSNSESMPWLPRCPISRRGIHLLIKPPIPITLSTTAKQILYTSLSELMLVLFSGGERWTKEKPLKKIRGLLILSQKILLLNHKFAS